MHPWPTKRISLLLKKKIIQVSLYGPEKAIKRRRKKKPHLIMALPHWRAPSWSLISSKITFFFPNSHSYHLAELTIYKFNAQTDVISTVDMTWSILLRTTILQMPRSSPRWYDFNSHGFVFSSYLVYSSSSHFLTNIRLCLHFFYKSPCLSISTSIGLEQRLNIYKAGCHCPPSLLLRGALLQYSPRPTLHGHLQPTQ